MVEESTEALVATAGGDPSDSREAGAQRIAALRRGGDFVEAVAAAEEHLADHPDDAFVWNEKGMALSGLRRYADAVAAFEEALLHDDANQFAKRQRIAALRAGRRFEEAVAAAEELLAAEEESVFVWNEKGKALYDLDRFEESVTSFDRALAAAPLDGFALAWKLAALRALGRSRDTITTLKRVLRSARKVLEGDPDRLDAWHQEMSALRSLRRLGDMQDRLAEALKRHPDDVFLLNEQAALAADRRRPGQALELIGRVLEIEPGNEFALALRVRILRLNTRVDEARQALEDVPPPVATSAGLTLERGWLALQEGRSDDAERSFREALVADPSPESTYALMAALERKHRFDEALDLLVDLRGRRPKDLDLAEQLGWFYLRRNRLDEARAVFRRIAEDDPDHLGGLNAKGAMAFTDERYEEAAEVFREMTRKDRWNATWHSNLAWALVRVDEGGERQSTWSTVLGRRRESRLAEAERRAERALDLDPLYPSAHGCLGVIAFRRGRYKEAESHFLRSMERDRLEGSLTDLGALWAEIGKTEEAQKILEEAVAANPDDPNARVELGSLLLGLGRPQKAIRNFRQAAAYAPESPRPAHALALALIEGKRWHEAEEVLREAIRRIEPHRAWRLHLTLAHLLVQRGDENDADSQLYEEARREVDAARRLRPEEPEVCFQAGVVWYRLEAYGRSLRNFRRCVELDPEQFEAVRNVERLRRHAKRARLEERGGAWASWLLVAVSIAQLGGAWALFLEARLAESSLLTLAAVSLGLLVVAILLPWLIRLKLPGGFEAQLAERTPSISPGPSGETSFGGDSAPRSRAALSRGPF